MRCRISTPLTAASITTLGSITFMSVSLSRSLARRLRLQLLPLHPDWIGLHPRRVQQLLEPALPKLDLVDWRDTEPAHLADAVVLRRGVKRTRPRRIDLFLRLRRRRCLLWGRWRRRLALLSTEQ